MHQFADIFVDEVFQGYVDKLIVSPIVVTVHLLWVGQEKSLVLSCDRFDLVRIADGEEARVLRQKLSASGLIISGIQQVAPNAMVDYNVFFSHEIGYAECVPHSV